MGPFAKLLFLLSMSWGANAVTFEHNRHGTFGVPESNTGRKHISVKNKKSNSSQDVDKEADTNKVIDDFDAAEKSIFDSVENVEKAVLNTASSLIHDEVDVLFGRDHGGSLRPVPISRKEEGRTSKKKTNAVKNVKNVNKKMRKEAKMLTMDIDIDKKSGTDKEDVMRSSQLILQEISDCLFE